MMVHVFMTAHGYVDQFAYSPTSGGILLIGWIAVKPSMARCLPVDMVSANIIGKTAAEDLDVQLAFFERSDLDGNGVGVVCLVKHTSIGSEPLRRIILYFERNAFPMEWGPATMSPPETQLIEQSRALVASSFAGHRDGLAESLCDDPFAGLDTIQDLPEFVRIAVDELILCPQGGAVLIGWILAWPTTIASLSLSTRAGTFPIRLEELVRFERPDVLDTVGRDWGFENSRCGFVVYVANAIDSGGPAWIRVQTRDRSVGYATVPIRRLHGMQAIRRILDVVELHDNDTRFCLDQIVGPACRALNSERLAAQPTVAGAQFGGAPAEPRISVVVPLFGKVHYLEDQLASFSRVETGRMYEFLYVLDDPPRRREMLALAESSYARFGVPFRLLTLDENRGFAPACNVGLRASRGAFVCFLNSDVFPVEANSLDLLADRLESASDLGIVAGLLLFEDGSVQHEGMEMQEIPNKGGLLFPMHPNKGWRPRADVGFQRVEMVTGACMLMRRSMAESLGGFDEGFIIGDFEDADLCVRARAMGANIAVDHAIRFLHLERQSQVEPSQKWRSNLTMFNAWLFDQRHGRGKTA